ncbi:hypothetical protein [Hyphobacterium sp.]|uniref:hypothetical protein n=1 Tax=Hyphobacterium sp. TaxID=2004662 RepID=UPI003B53050C
MAFATGTPEAAGTLRFQQVGPNGDTVEGSLDLPFEIGAGATQSLVLFTVPTGPLSSTDIVLDFICADDGSGNPVSARSILGVNTLSLSVSDTPVPDIVAVAATLNGEGSVRLLDGQDFEPVSLAAINVGAGDPVSPSPGLSSAADNEATITVRPRLSLPATGFQSAAPIKLDICETNSLGICTSERVSRRRTMIGTDPVFFKIRALRIPGVGVANLPDLVRVFVDFVDTDGVLRGQTSVAVSVEELTTAVNEAAPVGTWAIEIPGQGTGVVIITPDGQLWANLDFAQEDEPIAFVGLVERDGDTGANGIPFSARSTVVTGDDNSLANWQGTWRPRSLFSGTIDIATGSSTSNDLVIANDVLRMDFRSVFLPLTTLEIADYNRFRGSFEVIASSPSGPEVIGSISTATSNDNIDASLLPMTGSLQGGDIGDCTLSAPLTALAVGENLYGGRMTLSGPACEVTAEFDAIAFLVNQDFGGDTVETIAMIFANSDLANRDTLANIFETVTLAPPGTLVGASD